MLISTASSLVVDYDVWCVPGPGLLQCICKRIQMYLYFWSNGCFKDDWRGFSLDQSELLYVHNGESQ